MPSTRIDAAVREYSPEPVLCWCGGQSLESRYSSSVSGGTAALGTLIGKAVLRRKLGRARSANAVRMPRFPVVAAGATHVFIFDGPLPKRGPFATLKRDQVEVIYGGSPVWRRLDIIVRANGVSRAYTLIRFGPWGGAKQLRTLHDELSAKPRALPERRRGLMRGAAR